MPLSRTSLVVHWLRLYVFSAGIEGLIPGLGTKTLHATQHSQKKERNVSLTFWEEGLG